MQFRKPGRTRAVIDIAPLVDVVFLLVIFFAVSTTFLDSAGLKLQLPPSSSAADVEPREIAVLLGKDGRLSFEGREVDETELGERLEQVLAEAERKLVVLRADTDARHGDVVRVMDLIRGAGAEALTVAARPAGS